MLRADVEACPPRNLGTPDLHCAYMRRQGGRPGSNAELRLSPGTGEPEQGVLVQLKALGGGVQGWGIKENKGEGMLQTFPARGRAGVRATVPNSAVRRKIGTGAEGQGKQYSNPRDRSWTPNCVQLDILTTYRRNLKPRQWDTTGSPGHYERHRLPINCHSARGRRQEGRGVCPQASNRKASRVAEDHAQPNAFAAASQTEWRIRSVGKKTKRASRFRSSVVDP